MDDALLIVLSTNKPKSVTEVAAGWFSATGKPARSKAHRMVTRLMKAKLITVRRKRGNGNGGYGGRYRLTQAGQEALAKRSK